MTGFGRGVAEHAGTSATVDIRAVNHRFVDLKLRGVGLAPATEDAIGTRIRAAIERGALAVTVHTSRTDAAAAVRIDHDAARRTYDILTHLATRLGLGKPDLQLVLAQPGVLVVEAERGEADNTAVLAALDAALVQLAAMRETEGRTLATELTHRLDELEAARAGIAKIAAAVPELLAKRLRERIARLVVEVDPGRLAQEVVLLVDRADVTEELVRLASHLEQARALIAGTAASGRRLDFLVQEIGRELNTIGSKSTVVEITALVVEAKATLEKLREQVQNVE